MKFPNIKNMRFDRRKAVKNFLLKIWKVNFCSFPFLFTVTTPMLIAILYYGLIASPRYTSNAIVIIIKDSETTAQSFSIQSLVSDNSSRTFNSNLIANFIKSLDMMIQLNEKINLFSMYQTSNADWFSRLGKNPDQKEALKYYRSMLDVDFLSESGSLKISAQAFTPEEAYQIVSAIIELTQKSINDIDKNLGLKKLTFSHEQLKDAREKLYRAELEVLEFQDKYGIIDPQKSLLTQITIINQLKLRLSQEETELIGMKYYLNENSLKYINQKRLIESIRKQLEIESSKLTSLDNIEIKNQEEMINIEEEEAKKVSKNKLNYLAAKFEWLRMSVDIAGQVYKIALQGYEAEQVKATKEMMQLSVVEKQVIPDFAEYPRTGYILLSLLLILLMLYGMGRMIVTIIKEHKY